MGDRLSAGPMHYLRDGLELAAARLALRARGGRRGPHHDALHPAELDGRGAGRASSASRTWGSGVAIAVLAWLVIIGGVTSIGRAAEKLAPLKVGLYLAGRPRRDRRPTPAQLPAVLALILREAFSAARGAAAAPRASA